MFCLIVRLQQRREDIVIEDDRKSEQHLLDFYEKRGYVSARERKMNLLRFRGSIEN